ncbi:hypothetical protein [Paenibacillus sp. FSL L8-0709]|uniref:hypothetical protein n=1 Tax=Paenibacillus sp. FSL L8-0709 TaxID=2975312 RepID=UPI0030F518AC
MNINSTGKLFELLSGLEGQSIIASSLTLEEIKGVTKEVFVNVIDLGDEYIMKPLGIANDNQGK